MALMFRGFDPLILQKFKESMQGDSDFVNAVINGTEFFEDTTITSAQMLALFTTPITVVPAPGAGLTTVVTDVYSTLVFGTAAYSTNAAGASLFYKSDASGATVGITLTQAYLQSSSGTNNLYVRGGGTALAPDVNQPITIKASTSNPTTGDSAVKLRVFYRVVPVPMV